MILTGAILHILSVCITIFLTCLGCGLGGGFASIKAIQAINTAPSIKSDVLRLILLGLALIETGGIIGVIMGIILLNQPSTVENFYYIGIAEFGIALAIGIGGLIVGLASAKPAEAAIESLARQPFFSNGITNMMLITQSIIQTPVIFGFIVALLIKTQLTSITNTENALRMVAAGFAIGFGSIGPAIGLSRFASSALEAIGYNREVYGKVLTFSFISQAIIETPVIFSLLIAFIILFSPIDATSSPVALYAIFAAALCIAFSTLSPALSSSRVASSGCMQMARNPAQAMEVNKLSIIAQGLIDTAAIYGLLIALLILIFK